MRHTETGTVKIGDSTHPAQRNADGAVWYRKRFAGQVVERTATAEVAATFTTASPLVRSAELCDDPECDHHERDPHWLLRLGGVTEGTAYSEAERDAWLANR